MKANFLPQQLYRRVYIHGQQISQAIAASHIIVIALISMFVWFKPTLQTVDHISYVPVSEGQSLKFLDRTNRKKITLVSIQDTTVPVSKPTKQTVGLGHGFELIKSCESGGNYQAVNSAGYYGAYQFDTGTWNSTAQSAGRSDLIGVRPDKASVADQDAMAKQLHAQRGWQPWGCAYHVGLL